MKKMTFGAAVKATGTLTFLDEDVVGFLITIGGKGLQEGVDWTAGTIEEDAISLAAAINLNTAETLATAVAVGAVVHITANTAGTAGNAIVITVSSGGHTDQSAATLLGGAAQTGAVAFSGPGRVKSVIVQATGASGLGCQVLDGLTAGGTEYDLVTGVTTQSVARTYKTGLMLPTGCFLLPGANVTAVYIEYETI